MGRIRLHAASPSRTGPEGQPAGGRKALWGCYRKGHHALDAGAAYLDPACAGGAAPHSAARHGHHSICGGHPRPVCAPGSGLHDRWQRGCRLALAGPYRRPIAPGCVPSGAIGPRRPRRRAGEPRPVPCRQSRDGSGARDSARGRGSLPTQPAGPWPSPRRWGGPSLR